MSRLSNVPVAQTWRSKRFLHGSLVGAPTFPKWECASEEAA